MVSAHPTSQKAWNLTLIINRQPSTAMHWSLLSHSEKEWFFSMPFQGISSSSIKPVPHLLFSDEMAVRLRTKT
ncbi:MAG: hypothetical protein KME52_22985 [Desmonostoc geniculatum HA4340-LM1]|nr:hypothetical protein [Desmonostoc geniculatum HA4340-LM1]